MRAGLGHRDTAANGACWGLAPQKFEMASNSCPDHHRPHHHHHPPANSQHPATRPPWLARSASACSRERVSLVAHTPAELNAPLLTDDTLCLGLERTDNGMKQTSWPDVAPINQKNYYTYVHPEDTSPPPNQCADPTVETT